MRIDIYSCNIRKYIARKILNNCGMDKKRFEDIFIILSRSSRIGKPVGKSKSKCTENDSSLIE